MKRYANWCHFSHGHRLVESHVGPYVSYEDYESEKRELLTALRFWFPDKEDSRARSFPGEWERDFKLLERLK